MKCFNKMLVLGTMFALATSGLFAAEVVIPVGDAQQEAAGVTQARVTGRSIAHAAVSLMRRYPVLTLAAATALSYAVAVSVGSAAYQLAQDRSMFEFDEDGIRTYRMETCHSHPGVTVAEIARYEFLENVAQATGVVALGFAAATAYKASQWAKNVALRCASRVFRQHAE